ncbi:hypothetical protein [Catenuloplanes atrovinosus]|uniref:DivIVA domain-containing protein n=1 Tax=Catenuloplanes atrovinosus TaxID=137266 RepID=A0AAE3YK85_9ACTN|nr:hypothetical protein [Catenuloplanes atrovinosus]MDR7274447.1 DivIVA domain-containing protein [Catenuloplanes atrovinosus]
MKPIVVLLVGLLAGFVVMYGLAVLTESYLISAGVALIWFIALGNVVKRLPDDSARRRVPVPPAPGSTPNFVVVLRGYDMGEVRALSARIEAARASADPGLRAAVAAEVRGAAFHEVVRGFDRAAVDAYLHAAAADLSS